MRGNSKHTPKPSRLPSDPTVFPDNGSTAVFCGAGISRHSGLPTVEPLTSYILEKLDIAEKDREAILREIVEGRLPFESFVESLEEGTGDINDLLNIFKAGKPNTNHLLLAKLAKLRKLRTIATVNFDPLLEQALAAEGLQRDVDYDLLYREEQFHNTDWERDRLRLIKIHGSIENRQDMAITLKQVAQGMFSEGQKAAIRHLFSEGHHSDVLVIGYSCSDIFDITPHIKSLSTDRTKNVTLVEHHQGLTEYRIEDFEKEDTPKNPFVNFKNFYRIAHDTDVLTEKAWKRNLQEDYETKSRQEPTWQKNVDLWATKTVGHPELTDKYRVAGIIFFKSAQSEKALAQWTRGLELSVEKQESPSDSLDYMGLMGDAHKALGHYKRSIELYEQTIELGRGINDRKSDHFMINLGDAFLRTGNFKQAQEYYSRAREHAKSSRDQNLEALSLGGLGNVAYAHDDHEKAVSLYNRAIAHFKSHGNKAMEASCRTDLGSAYQKLKNYDKAIAQHERALEISRQLGNRHAEATSLGNLGNDHALIHDFAQAEKFQNQAIELMLAVGNKAGAGIHLDGLGITCLAQGESKRAIEYHKRALTLLRAAGDKATEGTCLGNLGNCYFYRRDFEQARLLYEESLEILRSNLDPRHTYLRIARMKLLLAKALGLPQRFGRFVGSLFKKAPRK